MQIREKDLPDRDLLELVRQARSLLPPPVRLLVNGRADVALAAGADGVHLPSQGISTGRARQRWGDRLIVGRSTHRRIEVEQQLREGADYVAFGPIWQTPGKGPERGERELARVCELPIPVLALGGVDRRRLARAATAGAAGAAAIRLFWDRESLGSVVDEAARCFPAGWDRLRGP